MNHPITPPPELVQQWLGTYFGTTVTGEVSGVELALATQAAQWGADQELEACIEEVQVIYGEGIGACIRDFRRPKPPSLKEQALEQLRKVNAMLQFYTTGGETATIREALEALPND